MRNLLFFAITAFPMFATAADVHPRFQGEPGKQLAFLLAILVLLAVVSLGFIATLSLYSLFRPTVVRAGSDFLRSHPFRCLIQGILVLALAFGIATLADQLPEPLNGLLALGLIFILAVLTVIGWSMVALQVGGRLLASLQSPKAGSAILEVIAGALLVALLSLLPIAGQLVHLVLWLIGLGAAISHAGRRRFCGSPELDAQSVPG